MAVNGVNVQMNAGNGDTSYTNNSAHQKIGILKSWPVLDETLKDMFNDNNGLLTPKCFRMADLGCSSGPNTLSVISRIIHKIEKNCNNSSPEFEVFLNDLPENDFNNLFKFLPNFYHKLNQDNIKENTKCFVSALPGSFYGRLFPTKSLHFVYSSYSLQWLSQVPKGLESNRENIHMAKESPPEVFEAYARQYQRDFSTFLSSRGAEMVPGLGRMVLIFVGRSVADPSSQDDCGHFTLLANTLVDMVAEGLIKEADLHSFNMPIYTPCKQEVEAVIRDEGSFNLDKLEEFQVPWDAHVERGGTNGRHCLDKNRRGELVSNFIRAYSEPVLATHFGSCNMDELYERYGKKLGEYLSREEPSLFFNIAISLSKR